jgi:Ca2+-binding EF-hand superfamily protein
MRIVMLCAALAMAPVAAVAGSHGQSGGNAGAHFIENWDLDGDGAVTVAEAEERRADVFAAFDADEDGSLSSDEYDMFDAARANDLMEMGLPAKAATGDNPAGLMRREMTDADGDGTVTRAEFLGSAAAWIARMDSDGDGRVTAADFPRK